MSMNMIRLIICLLAVVLMVGGCSPDPINPVTSSGDSSSDVGSSSDSDTSGNDAFDQVENLSIAALKNLYIDGSHSLTNVVLISGTITANNVLGEFPDLLFLEDSSGAIEISVDLGDMLYDCKLGYQLTLNCTDLWLGSRGGTLVLGCEPTGDDVVDPISEYQFSLRAAVSESSSAPTPTSVTIPNLNESLISCFVTMSGLTFQRVDGLETFCLRDEDSGRYLSTTHILEDANGNEIELFVPSTASYAKDDIPDGTGIIFGVVSSFAGVYSLRIVYAMYFFSL